MRVRIYRGQGEIAEIGAVRYDVEWQTVKPKARERIAANEARGALDEVDVDRDLDHHHEHHALHGPAVKAAKAIVQSGVTAYGVAIVQRQVVDWLEEAPDVGLGEWRNDGEPEYVG